MTGEERELPQGWIETNLGEATDYGRTTKVEPDEIHPDAWVLELEDIEKDSSKVIQRFTFAERNSKSTKNYFGAGDVLYGKLRPYLNKVVLANAEGYSTTEIVPIKASELLDSRFVFYWLKHPEFINYVTSVSHGMSMPRLGTDSGRSAPIVLAPLPEQVRIADKLDALLSRVEAGRERLERVPKLIKRFRQAVLSAAVSGELTAEWRGISAQSWVQTTIKECTTNFDNLRIPVKKSERDQKNGDYPYYGAFGVIDYIDNYLFDGEYLLLAEDGKNLEVRSKDIALIATGRFWVNNHAHVMQARSGVELRFLKIFFNSPSNGIEAALTGIDQIKLTRGALDSLKIKLPPVEEQEEIVRRVEALFALSDRLEARYSAALASFDRLTPAILAKAFRGELVPQDPNDEPASVLLERIRAERGAAGAGKPQRGRKAGSTGGPAGGDEQGTKRRGRPHKVHEQPAAESEARSGIASAGSYAEAVRLLQEQAERKDRQLAARQNSLFDRSQEV